MSAPFSAHLFISNIDYKTWILSGGPNIVASLHGIGIEKYEFPGVLIGFPSAQSALKAAGRIFSELGGGMKVSGIPPMVVAHNTDPNLLPTYVFGLEKGTILITNEAARFVSGEPIELKQGPEIPRESGPAQETKIFSTNSANLGWALPTLGFDPRKTPYFRENKVPDLIETFSKPNKVNYRWMIKAGYWGVLFGIPMLGLIVVYSFLSSHVVSKKAQEELVAIDRTLPSVTDSEKNQLLGTVPTIVPGFGDIFIEVEPIDAKVFLNNKLVGKKSPHDLKHKESDVPYSMVVKRKGYETYNRMFSIDPDQVTKFKIKLVKR